MEIQTGYAAPTSGPGGISAEAIALLALKDGESLLLPRRKNDSHGGWAHFAQIAKRHWLRVIQRREGDFMRFWVVPI